MSSPLWLLMGVGQIRRISEMPRQPRLHIPGLVHHVMARGIEGSDIFRDDDDREGFLKRLAGQEALVCMPGL